MSLKNIRKVNVLDGRVKEKANKMGLDDDDLVLVETEIKKGGKPEYKLTEIEGSATEFLKEELFGEVKER